MDNKKKFKAVGLLLISLGIFIFLSLYYFDPTDVEDVSVNNVKHAMGFIGFKVSAFLFRQTIGWASYIFPILIILWGINQLLKTKLKWLRKVSLYTMLFGLYVSVGWALIELIKISASGTPNEINMTHENWGKIGALIGDAFYGLFGTIGSVVIFPTIFVVTVLLAVDIKFDKLFQKLDREFKKALAHLFLKYDPRMFKPTRPTPTLNEIFGRKSGEKESSPESADVPFQDSEEVDMEEPPGDFVRPGVEKPVADVERESRRPERPVPGTEPAPATRTTRKYYYPSVQLLDEPPVEAEDEVTWDELMSSAKILEEKLLDFGIQGKVVEINPGPVITRFEIEPAPGVKISRFTSLADDLALVMRAKRIRVVAPIPGKAAVGIEIPNRKPSIVFLRSVLDSSKFKSANSPLTMALGKTIAGDIFIDDLARMPHLLIAGATGAGKSVCLNTIIASILYKSLPSQVQFVMIDPKRLELSGYAALKHHHLTYRDDLQEEVITNPSNAVAILRSLEMEMERRYELLARAGVRNIEDYNQWIKNMPPSQQEENQSHRHLEYIVLIIDELADLMVTAAREVEEPIARLTQMSRAVGIHLIVATQRPSVDVITGVIKANFPARIAFQVASKTDSRTILDMNGAEKLLGRGDMLFIPPGSPEPIRIHSPFISHEEVKRIIEHIRQQPAQDPKTKLPTENDDMVSNTARKLRNSDRDELFNEALKLVVRHQQGSVSLLQRRLKIGYARAARLIDQLEDAGYVGPFDGSKAREVLVDEEQLIELGLI
ncbi:MAG: DNA translocase FtsK 4TM domain-containing protein [Candidatus Zhuqueibacterota bacterium]